MGKIAGYACVFNCIDQQQDMIERGAFDDILKQHGAIMPKMYYEHQEGKILGQWEKMEADEHGLWMEGQVDEGAVKLDHIKGLSLGFYPLKTMQKQGVCVIQKARVVEVSLVKNPAQDLACVIKV